MKVIILAAGEGSRLKPFTDDRPKCLVEVAGKSILDRQLEIVKAAGIDDIVVVKGYKADKIIRSDVKYYYNKDYDITNMVMSLWCAEKELEGEVIIAYGDIIYNKEVLEKLINSPYDIGVVVDMEWEKYWRMRFDNPLDDAEALKMDNKGNIKVIGQKPKKIEDIEAGYIGLIKFKAKGIDAFRKSFLQAKEVGLSGGKPWDSPRSFEKAYMTDMLQGLIKENNAIVAVKINGGWLEIDDCRDLEVAKKLIVDDKICKI